MVRRVITLTEKDCGLPPSPYAWLGMGSEGRKEQTLLTDQDNAIIFSGPSSEQTLDYFRRFSTRVVEGLHQCGIPLCQGGVMASNPKYFGNVTSEIENHGMDRPHVEEKELMDTMSFDFRAVRGTLSRRN
jgi:CBS domain-containing protein